MDFHYNITIKGSSDTIEFIATESSKNDAITGVDFGFNSNNDAEERDRKGRTEIRIFGKFDGRRETINAIKQLSEWARSNNDVYREVTIVLTTSENSGNDGNFSRTYHFDKMFCIDYFERTGSAVEKGSNVGLSFELFMAQAPTYNIDETKAEII